jgi:hypothetical protein
MSAPVWGRTVLEPDRGHVREPGRHWLDASVVGFALCGAWLVADLPDQHDPFPRCSACVALLAERRS